MQKIILKNGLTVIYQEKEANSVAVEILVKAGSNKENAKQRGISHFIEHLVFEGTKKRANSQKIANEIERIGGELNAYTSNEKTCFFAKVPKKSFVIALEIIADIVQNPLFKEEDIKKEKNVVGKEIDMVNDNPRFYQWILFEKNLYDKHPVRFPTYGEKKTVLGLGRKEILEHYRKYYLPNKMVLSIVGKVKDWRKKVEEKFIFEKGEESEEEKIKEGSAKKNKIRKEKRKIANTYLVLGYKTVPRSHPDSYALDVINGVLGRGQSGWMFQEIRSKKGLAYEVGTQHVSEESYGYFAIYLSIDRQKLRTVKELILEQLDKLKKITGKELEEAKNYIEGSYLLEVEDTQKLADHLCFWEQVGEAKEIENFVKRIKKVSREEIKKAVEKYFRHYCLVIIEGK